MLQNGWAKSRVAKRILAKILKTSILIFLSGDVQCPLAMVLAQAMLLVISANVLRQSPNW
jgi:hypothetical protein